MIYGNKGNQVIQVPEGLDGKIWHFRTDMGSGTKLPISHDPQKNRFPALYLTLETKGVPGYLAPTWEQWFDPEKPEAPLDRP